jgi:hypothetical protein
MEGLSTAYIHNEDQRAGRTSITPFVRGVTLTVFWYFLYGFTQGSRSPAEVIVELFEKKFDCDS